MLPLGRVQWHQSMRDRWRTREVCDVKLTGRPVPILLDGGTAAHFLSASVAAEMRLPLKDTVEDGVAPVTPVTGAKQPIC